MSASKFIVELEESCWLADWSGDTGRTFVRNNARKYKTARGAAIALGRAKAIPFRRYDNALVIEIKE